MVMEAGSEGIAGFVEEALEALEEGSDMVAMLRLDGHGRIAENKMERERRNFQYG